MDNHFRTIPSDPDAPGAGETEPYAPSFLDRLMGFGERLPGPTWLTYLVLFVAQSTLTHVLGWLGGWLPAYTFEPILLMFPLWLWAPLAIMTYLNSISLEALSSFSPLLDVPEERLNRLKDELTTMPARSVILSGVIWSIVFVILTYLMFDTLSISYAFGTSFTLILSLEGLVSFSTGSGIYYHSLRQLRLVNRTVKMVEHIDLFQLDPVYAFSRLTARTGVAWMIMLSLTLLLFPIQLANAPVLAILVLQVALALAAFVLPLRFVNHRLVSEKRRLSSELNRRLERTLERLHRCVDENDMGDVEQINYALANLGAERDVLTGIPTWPWRSGTLTGFLSALVLPIVLFLIQFAMEHWVGR
jgi:hypothetical protein